MRAMERLVWGLFLSAVSSLGCLSVSGQGLGNRSGSPEEATAHAAVLPVSPSASAAEPFAPASRDSAATATHRFSALGVGLGLSSLGIDIDAATPLSHRTNLRAGFHVLNAIGANFTSDEIAYSASLKLRSFDALLDIAPFAGGFHISPGLLCYNGNRLTGTAAVGRSQSFTMNDTGYISDPQDPVTGNGSLKLNAAAPMVLLGWGNLVPRTRRFSVPFEVGLVFQGSPKVALDLTGSVCNPDGKHCTPIDTTPSVLANVQAEQTKLSDDAAPFKYYPIISLGIAYKFSWAKVY